MRDLWWMRRQKSSWRRARGRHRRRCGLVGCPAATPPGCVALRVRMDDWPLLSLSLRRCRSIVTEPLTLTPPRAICVRRRETRGHARRRWSSWSHSRILSFSVAWYVREEAP